MRRRSVQLSILILVILGLSAAALGFRDINIDLPGFPALVRGGDGPLGLKLGLDLSGGGHLVYQADTGTRIEVGFADPTRGVVVEEALESFDVIGYDIRPLDDRNYVVTTDLLDDVVKEGLEDAITLTRVEFSFDPELDLPEDPAVDDVAQEQGLENYQVEQTGVDNFFRITTTSALDEGQRDELETALAEGVGEVTEFSTETVGTASFSLSEIQPPTADQMEGVLDRINRRVNLFGTEEPIIQLFGEDRVIVQLPGASGSISQVGFSEPTDVAAVEGVLAAQGYEDFTVDASSDTQYEIRTISINVNQQSALRSALSSGVGEVVTFETTGGIETAKALIGQTAQLVFKERTCSDVTCFTFTDAEIGLTGDDLESAFASTDPNTGEWEVNIAFGDRGTGIFGDLTQRIVGIDTKRIAVFLDDELLIAPVSLAWIRDGRSSITGNFSREEARTLAIQLEAGSLPVPLELIQESDVDALLGEESLKKSLLAGIIGLGLVMVFMVAYYRMAGIIAAVALVFYTVVVLAVFKLVPVTLGLSGIGAFILSIGLAVDANILIFERMKEEIRIGRTLASSMEVGFSRAWPAIRDGNFSTIITCMVLLWLGSRTADDLVTGFAFTLFIGVVVSMFTAIVLSRNLLQLMAWIGLGRQMALFSPEGSPRPGSGARAGAAGQPRNV
ncbi:MAG: protein translocase subunit SecD [Chloroflexota bacterium]|nr:protein translocase subunit SecD [Chloroflexota bacterium]